MVTEKNLAELFRNRAHTYQDKVRWRERRNGVWQSATWRENLELVNSLIAGLDALGARRGDVIGIVSNTRWEWMAADWAIIGLGGVTVTVYPSNVPSVTAFILNDSDARYVFAEDRTQYEKLKSIQESLPQVRKVILFDDAEQFAGDPWVMSLDALRTLSGRSAAEADAFAAARMEEIQPEDSFTLVYTSGTTGMPKGVMHTHATCLSQLASLGTMLHTIRPGMVDLLFLPLAHVFGRAEAIGGYELGVETVVEPSLDTLVEDMRATHPDLFFSVPRVYEKAYAAILAKAEAGSAVQKRIFAWAVGVGRAASIRQQQHRPLSPMLRLRYALADRLVFAKIRAVLGGNLKFAVTAGGPLDPRIIEFFHGAGILLLEAWGLTETCAGFTLNKVDDFRFGTVGKVFPGQELRIADDGEILVRGPVVFKGYHNNPEATAEAIDAEGWFHTGDIGTIDDDGFVRIVDRKKDLIITAGGKNIAPQMVENTLKTVPCVSQVVVYGDRKPYLVGLITLDPVAVKAWADEQGIAYGAVQEIYTHPQFRAFLDERIAQANSQLARYETMKYYDILPDDFTVENELLTPTLKLRRRQIYARYRDRFEALYRPGGAEMKQHALG